MILDCFGMPEILNKLKNKELKNWKSKRNYSQKIDPGAMHMQVSIYIFLFLASSNMVRSTLL